MTSVATTRQLAGAGAARAAVRRRNRMQGGARRPGWVTYLLLSLTVLVSVLPLYYAFLLASSTAGDIARTPIPSPLPQGHFFSRT